MLIGDRMKCSQKWCTVCGGSSGQFREPSVVSEKEKKAHTEGFDAGLDRGYKVGYRKAKKEKISNTPFCLDICKHYEKPSENVAVSVSVSTGQN